MADKKTYEFTDKINDKEDKIDLKEDTKEEIVKNENIEVEVKTIKSSEEVIHLDKLYRIDNSFTIYEKAFLTERFRNELHTKSEWDKLIKKATSERLR